MSETQEICYSDIHCKYILQGSWVKFPDKELYSLNWSTESKGVSSNRGICQRKTNSNYFSHSHIDFSFSQLVLFANEHARFAYASALSWEMLIYHWMTACLCNWKLCRTEYCVKNIPLMLTSESLVLYLTNMSINLSNMQSYTHQEYAAMGPRQ